MSVSFSIIYPTRHRPAFIAQALRFLEQQQYKKFEVIVSDNYIDPSLSCANICKESSLNNIKHVRPPEPLGMVGNWNYALQFATNEYIVFMTDKMFLLPASLSFANACIESAKPDIVTWIDNVYYPNEFPYYFDQGEYKIESTKKYTNEKYITYDPRGELSKKGRAKIARNEQDKSHYARGKICFGAYSSKLCERIIKNAGELFHNVCPDYTSMILGLSFADSAIEIAEPGIVHINTDLSNGGQSAVKDDVALNYLEELEGSDNIINSMLVPGLYCSTHNLVSHDYITLREKYSLEFEFNRINWLVYIYEDIYSEWRIWSSKDVENTQKNIFEDFINNELNSSELEAYLKKVKAREKARSLIKYDKSPVKNKIKSILSKILVKSILPKPLRIMRKKILFSSDLYVSNMKKCSTIGDILKN